MRPLAKRRFGRMVALVPPEFRAVPLRRAVGHGKIRSVPLDSDVIRSGRSLGASFGD